MKRTNLLALIEGAIMIAFSVVFSMITIIKMPFGGGITAASMIPIILVSYRKKIKWGVIIAFVYGLLQLLLGMENLQYATSFWAVCAIIFLDYILAFSVLGFGGVFRNKLSSQCTELVVGALVVCALRYVCHLIAGCTVWAGVSIPTADGFIYSAAYNAAYMIPETVITVAGIWYLGKMIDFRNDKPSAYNGEKGERLSGIINGAGVLVMLGGIVFSALYVFHSMQSEDGFDITGIKEVNVGILLPVLLSSAIIFLVLHLVSKRIKSKG